MHLSGIRRLFTASPARRLFSASPARRLCRGHLAVESLESRQMLATFSYAGQTLAIGLDKAAQLSVTSSGNGNYLLSVNGGDKFSGTDTAGLTGNGLATLTVTDSLALTSVSISNSVDGPVVAFLDSTGSYVDGFTVALAQIAGGGVPYTEFRGTTTFAGSAALSVTAPTVSLATATVSTATGPLTLKGDTGAAIVSNSSGIVLSASTLSSSGGTITLTGRAGNGSSGNLRGVAIISGSTVYAGDDGSNFPTLTINGTGGKSSGGGNANDGIYLDAMSTVQSTGASVVLSGVGGGANDGNRGIALYGTVSTGSANPGVANLTLTGGGGGSGASAKDNAGIFLASSARVTANKAPVAITGTGGVGTTSTTPPYASSPGLSVDSPTIVGLNGTVTLKADSYTFANSTSGLLFAKSTLSILNANAGQVLRLDATANSHLARVIAKDLVIGDAANLPVIEQAKAAAGGAIAIGSPNLTVNGSAIRLRTDVTNTGTQTWNGPVILGADADAGDVQLSSKGITFKSTIDGAKNLTLAAGTGDIRLEEVLGGTTPLASLQINSAESVVALKKLVIDGSAAGARPHGILFNPGVNRIDMQATGSTVANCTGIGMILYATHDSKIAGFTLTKNTIAGLQVNGVQTATTIAGNRIDGSGASSYGAFLNGATGLSLGTASAGNVFTGNSVGIVAVGDLTGTTIRANNVSSNTGGLWLNDAKNLSVTGGNHFVANKISGIYAIGDGTGTSVTLNQINDSTFGVLLDRVQKLTLGAAGQNNTIAPGLDTGGTYRAATSYGVYGTGNLTGTTVVSNSIIDNTVGMYLHEAKGVVVNGGNLLYRNRLHGIVASGLSTSTTIQGNAIDGSLPGGGRAPYGVYLLNAKQMLVGGSVSGQANAIYATNVAICATGALDGTAVTGNSLGNNNTGLYMKSATNVWVASNDSFGSSAYGFCATGICSGSTVTGNSVHNGEYGLVFDSAQGVAANGNRVYANRLFGLLALGVSHGTIVQGNTIAGNGTNISTASAIGGSFQTS